MKSTPIALALSLLFIASSAHAYSPIIRSYHSVRAAGMGDVRYTTGLFDENFFGNPARLARNPNDLFQLPTISVEAGSSTLNTVSSLTKNGGGDGLSKFADAVGEPISASVQMVFPAYYNKEFLASFWSFALGMEVRAQTVAEVGESALIDPTTIVNAGPVVSIARKLLPNNALTVGVNAHGEMRASSGSMFSVLDFLKGTDVDQVVKGGSAMGYDFDFGVSFRPHWTLGGFSYEVDGAVNNLLGGKYDNIKKNLISGWDKQAPIGASRSYNFGVSASRTDLPMFTSLTLALEATDIGNNPDGSVFRNLHLGAEGVARIMTFRAGINQGYWTAGFGLDLRFFELNIASYGEELGLNAGVQEDRRYAAEFGFKI